MSDPNYIDYLERQFASPTHLDEPPRRGFVIASSDDNVQESHGDLAKATAMLRPTSIFGPALGLTTRDIEIAARKLRGGIPLSYHQQIVKRALDLAIAIPALVVLALLTPILAALIKLDSPGPVFYRQERLGLGDSRFLMWKFRTMRLDARDHLLAVAALSDGEGSGGVLFKLRADPRITRVGRLLRKYSIDEFPQFINVLVGDMSIVGPRPPLPVEASSRRPLTIQPGFTGLWTVSGHSDLSWDDAAMLDEVYAVNWSLRGDLVILAKTMKVIVDPGGSY